MIRPTNIEANRHMYYIMQIIINGINVRSILSMIIVNLIFYNNLKIRAIFFYTDRIVLSICLSKEKTEM